MARDAIRLWQMVITEVGRVEEYPCESYSRHRVLLLRALLQQLHSTPALPRAIWKALITEKQVRPIIDVPVVHSYHVSSCERIVGMVSVQGPLGMLYTCAWYQGRPWQL